MLEKRRYKILGKFQAPNGRTYWAIRCPWCEKDFTAWLNRMLGAGRRCPNCRALHTWPNQLVEKPETQETPETP